MIGHTGEHLHIEVATAMFGGMALYLLAHLAFRWRNVRRFSAQRLVVAVVCIASVAVVTHISALVALAWLAILSSGLIVYETWRFREVRAELLARLAAQEH